MIEYKVGQIVEDTSRGDLKILSVSTSEILAEVIKPNMMMIWDQDKGDYREVERLRVGSRLVYEASSDGFLEVW